MLYAVPEWYEEQPRRMWGAQVVLERGERRIEGKITRVRALPMMTLITLDNDEFGEVALDGPEMWTVVEFTAPVLNITDLEGGVVIEAKVKVGGDWIYEEPVRMLRVDWGPKEEEQNQSPRKSWVTRDGVIVNDDRIVDPIVMRVSE